MLIEKYKRSACFLHQTYSLKYSAQMYDVNFNMLELVKWGSLSWGTHKNLSSSSFVYRHWSREFWVILKGECCGALFLLPNIVLLYFYLQPVNSHFIREIFQLSNGNIKPCFWKMYCPTRQWQPTVTKNFLNFVEDLMGFAMTSLKLC